MKPCACAGPHVTRRVVLTGGPGAGKTAVLELSRLVFCEHVRTLPEAAGIVFGGRFPRSDRPPLRQVAIPAAGRSQIATIRAFMENMLAGGHISEHDYLIGHKVAIVMCGGEIEAGSLVDEQWFLDLERKHFMELIATEKTQARIEHTLKTGKPLRNYGWKRKAEG